MTNSLTALTMLRVAREVSEVCELALADMQQVEMGRPTRLRIETCVMGILERACDDRYEGARNGHG